LSRNKEVSTLNKPDQYLAWMADGYKYFNGQLTGVDDEQLAKASNLPTWSRKHIAAHVGFNARALARLVHWAKTGEATPMYSSSTARSDEIVEGERWGGARLRELVSAEQAALVEALHGLSDADWSAKVVTGQGRTVPASEIPWLRTRELWIHAVDLGTGGDFDDLPQQLIDKLVSEEVAKRRVSELPGLDVRPTDRGSDRPPGGPVSTSVIEGRANDLARWLTGRGIHDVRTSDGAPLPELGPWL
jgi:maleylpyruvate isomerase